MLRIVTMMYNIPEVRLQKYYVTQLHRVFQNEIPSLYHGMGIIQNIIIIIYKNYIIV